MQSLNVPAFLIDRAIECLEDFKLKIDEEIAQLEAQKSKRDWHRRHRRQIDQIKSDIMADTLDEFEAVQTIAMQGHRPAYAAEILTAFKTAARSRQIADRDAEIFRRAQVSKESRTALAVEFGLSRSQVHRIIQKESRKWK